MAEWRSRQFAREAASQQGASTELGPVPPGRVGVKLPPVEGYRRGAVWVSIAMIAIVALRLHELMPFVSKLRPALLVAYGGIAFLLVHTAPSAIRSAFREPIFHRVLMYVGWCALTVPLALWKGAALGGVQALIPATILVLGLLLCPPTRVNLGRVEFGFVVASTLFAMALLALGSSSMDDRLSISSSLDSNDIAAIMAMAIPLAAGFIAHHRGWKRFVAAGAAAAMGLAVVASGSRGGTIALVVGVLVFVFGLGGSRKLVMLTLFGVGAVVGWSTAPASFRERIISIGAPEDDYNYTAYSGRWQVWGRAVGYTVNHPLLGVGINNFPVAEGEALAALKLRGKWSTTHNAYLQAFAELGIPGGIIYASLLWLVGQTAFRQWRKRRRSPVGHRPELLAALCAFATSAVFLSHAYFYAMFGLIGLIALADRVARLEAALPYRTIVGRPRRGDPPISAAAVGPEMSGRLLPDAG